jgi:hypothetical protein
MSNMRKEYLKYVCILAHGMIEKVYVLMSQAVEGPFGDEKEDNTYRLNAGPENRNSISNQ